MNEAQRGITVKMNIRTIRIIKTLGVVFAILAVISVRFILRDTVTNTRDYYLLDDKISVTYDVETIYNPLTQKYDAVGEITIEGYEFVIDTLTKKDSITFDFESTGLHTNSVIPDKEVYTIIRYSIPIDYYIQITEPVGMIIDDDYQKSAEGYVVITYRSEVGDTYVSK